MRQQSFIARKHAGFTIVELTVALVVISLLIVATLQGTKMIDAAKAADVVSGIKDLSAAARQFKERYRYWPGDLPNADQSLPNMPAICQIQTSTANIGDGQINTAAEVGCAIEQLFQAGMIRAVLLPGATLHTVDVSGANVRLIAASVAGVTNFPPGTNLVELLNLKCDLARTADSKMDDDNIAFNSAGRQKSSVTSCSPGATNDPVPFYAAAIN